MLQYTDRLERDRVQYFRTAASGTKPFNMYLDPVTQKLHMRRVDEERAPLALPVGCIWIGNYKRPALPQYFLDDLRAVVGAGGAA